MTNLIKLPKRFFDDHSERDFETPTIIKETKSHYWVDKHDPNMDELISDANYYVDMADMGAWDRYLFGIVQSARATLKAINGGIK